MEWWESAACGPSNAEHFFPEGRALKHKVAQAKAVCRDCVVQPQCLAWALTSTVEGVWGGHTQRERRKLLQIMPT